MLECWVTWVLTKPCVHDKIFEWLRCSFLYLFGSSKLYNCQPQINWRQDEPIFDINLCLENFLDFSIQKQQQLRFIPMFMDFFNFLTPLILIIFLQRVSLFHWAKPRRLINRWSTPFCSFGCICRKSSRQDQSEFHWKEDIDKIKKE